MNRTALIGVAGAIIAIVAIALTYVMDDSGGEAQNAAVRSAAPAAPAPVANVGGTKSSAAPSAPSDGLQAPDLATDPVKPSFDIVRINPQGDAVIAGRAAPNAEVTIRDRDKIIGTAKADARGEWVQVPSEPLLPGSTELSLSAKTEDAAPVESDKKVVLIVPKKGKDIAGRDTGETQGAMALAVPREGGGGVVVLQRPQAPAKTPDADAEEAEPAAGVTASAPTPRGPAGSKASSASSKGIKSSDLSLDAVDYDDSGNVTVSGTAPSQAGVQVYLDNKAVGAARTDDKGRWSVEPSAPVQPGLYTLRVDQVAETGKVVARVETAFRRAESLAGLPKDAFVFVQPGNNLWQIARRTYGEGMSYAVIFDANKDQIRDPDLIYPGQVFLLPKVN